MTPLAVPDITLGNGGVAAACLTLLWAAFKTVPQVLGMGSVNTHSMIHTLTQRVSALEALAVEEREQFRAEIKDERESCDHRLQLMQDKLDVMESLLRDMQYHSGGNPSEPPPVANELKRSFKLPSDFDPDGQRLLNEQLRRIDEATARRRSRKSHPNKGE